MFLYVLNVRRNIKLSSHIKWAHCYESKIKNVMLKKQIL